MAFPEWAKQHKRKGVYIGKNRDGYFLYTAKSVYDPITKKGKKVFTEYLGVINEKDGFIPKSNKLEDYIVLEYGLSNFVFKNFRTLLRRHIYSIEKNFTDNIIIVAIVFFVFNSTDCFSLSYLSVSNGIEQLPNYITGRRRNTLSNLSAIIKGEIERKLGEMPYDYFCAKLKNVLAIKKYENYEFMDIPRDLKEVMEKQGWEL